MWDGEALPTQYTDPSWPQTPYSFTHPRRIRPFTMALIIAVSWNLSAAQLVNKLPILWSSNVHYDIHKDCHSILPWTSSVCPTHMRAHASYFIPWGFVKFSSPLCVLHVSAPVTQKNVSRGFTLWIRVFCRVFHLLVVFNNPDVFYSHRFSCVHTVWSRNSAFFRQMEKLKVGKRVIVHYSRN